MTETCEVCGRTGKDGERCMFGARAGLCSCWRGVPCVEPDPDAYAAAQEEAEARRLDAEEAEAADREAERDGSL